MYDVLSEDIETDHMARLLADVSGANWGAVAVEKTDGVTEMISNAVFSGLPDLYADDYPEQDPWRIRRPRIYDQAIDTASYLAEAEWRQSGFFNEILRPHGIDPGRTMVGAVRLESGVEAIVGVSRPSTAEPFSDAQRKSLSDALPHMRRILKLQAKLNQAQVSSAFSDAALDAFPMAIIRVSANGAVVHHNRHAGQIIERSDGLAVRGGKLVATHETADNELQAALHHALRRSGPISSMISARKPDGDYLSMMISPISRRGESQVLIVIHGPQFDGGSRRARISSLFRLSTAELDLAMGLLEGRTLAEIALARHASINTLRVQLRSVLKKTGASRQAELVALLARLPVMQTDS